MNIFSPEFIISLIQDHGILAIIIGVIIETIITPIPSPVILMAAGAILIESTNLFTIILGALSIAIIAGLTQTIASLVLYIPGYYIGKPFITKFEKFHGVSWKEIEEFEKKFRKYKYEGITIFILEFYWDNTKKFFTCNTWILLF
jgi:membrane protein DedA with SNARE-associated domain